jgi:UDP-N-acetylmuramate--alanine ligase
MIELKNIKRVYLLGIGGIGMSALARYFKFAGMQVSGYDKTPSPLTEELIAEGIPVHFSVDLNLLPQLSQLTDTLVIYTPAVPESFGEMAWLRSNNFTLVKAFGSTGCTEQREKLHRRSRNAWQDLRNHD